ncbi:MAG TPA: tRNA preQ1(34) S-adenosylmethionine ribosyltransferase-isomerase QueA [Thermoanaerobacterales bacterium]|nr:tRNA preQ1(34) S-adenosylmethionine ribosyltransferase-isomerase QueA [Thermoanaerobacterales bacterium]
MKLKDFDYYLPNNLIAQTPIRNRDESRLMIIKRDSGMIEHRIFKDLYYYLNKGDCLVLNNTRVIPARLLGKRKHTKGKIELVLLKSLGNDRWETLVKPGKRAKIGNEFVFGDGKLYAQVVEYTDFGGRIIKFSYNGILNEIIDEIGMMPLPPYIRKKIKNNERYQTIYSKIEGSAAAPTAGFHFTEELLNKLKLKGVKIVYITLHVGLGTFRPVKTEDISNHVMHKEYFTISQESAHIINSTKKSGNKVIAVGTTSTRAIETAVNKDGNVIPSAGWTDIFIFPGYEFKIIDNLITNFHLPKSTLLMLVSAFAGNELIQNAYAEAIKNRYRFFSFGDAMLIL